MNMGHRRLSLKIALVLFLGAITHASDLAAQCLPGLPCSGFAFTGPGLEDHFDTVHPNTTNPANVLTSDLACDAGFMNQIHAVAHMHAERQYMTLENQLRKPDSVLEYSCFHQDMVLAAEWLPWVFSESQLFSNRVTSDGNQDGNSAPGDGDRWMQYSSVCLEQDSIRAWDGSGSPGGTVGAQGRVDDPGGIVFTRSSGHPTESPQCAVNDPTFYNQNHTTLFPDSPAIRFDGGPLHWERYHGNMGGRSTGPFGLFSNTDPTESDQPHTPYCRQDNDHPEGDLPYENNRFAQIHNCDVPPLAIDVNMRDPALPLETNHLADGLEELVWRNLVHYIGMNNGNPNFGHDFLGGYTSPGHIGGIGPIPLGSVDIDDSGGAPLCPNVNGDDTNVSNGCDEAADDVTDLTPPAYENLMPPLAPAPDVQTLLEDYPSFTPIRNARLDVPDIGFNIPGIPGSTTISANPLLNRNGTLTSSFTCDFMNRIWEWTRCDNAYSFEFFSFATLHATDVRVFPSQCNTSPRLTPSILELNTLAQNNLGASVGDLDAYNSANYIGGFSLGIGTPAGPHTHSTANIDDIRLRSDIYDDTACGVPVPSGMMATFLSYSLDTDGNANVRSVNTPAMSCIQPGCFYDGTECVRCTQTGGSDCAIN